MSIIFIFVALFIDSFIQFNFKKNIFFQDLQNYTDLSFITSFLEMKKIRKFHNKTFTCFDKFNLFYK